jgi:hypothetical protein
METEDEIIIQESIPTMDAELFASGNIIINSYGTGGYYLHEQNIASNEWTITHNLGFYPNIRVKNSAGDFMVTVIEDVNINSSIVRFDSNTSGVALCS